jgi:hypothetical protein
MVIAKPDAVKPEMKQASEEDVKTLKTMTLAMAKEMFAATGEAERDKAVYKIEIEIDEPGKGMAITILLATKPEWLSDFEKTYFEID